VGLQGPLSSLRPRSTDVLLNKGGGLREAAKPRVWGGLSTRCRFRLKLIL